MNRVYHIGILTTLWKRHDLEDIVLEYYRNMHLDSVVFHRVAVGSEGEVSRFIAEASDWHYIEAPNNPLSDKWNAGMRYLEGKVDAVLIVGSDDLLAPSTIHTLIAEWENGADVVSLEDLYYYDLDTDSLYYSVRSHPGAGMLVGASVLMRVSWQPWPSGKDIRLDGAMTNKLNTEGYPCRHKYLDNCREKGLVLVDIKSGINMWSVDQMKEMTDRVNLVPTEELEKTFPGLRELLTKTIEETNG